MTTRQRDRTTLGWLALLALPVVCCIGHVVLLAVGVGTLSTLAGAATGSRLLITGGVLLAVAAAAVAVRRRTRT